MTKRLAIAVFLVFLSVLLTVQTFGQGSLQDLSGMLSGSTGSSPEKVMVNPAGFQVMVAMNRENRTYMPGEYFQLSISTERRGYLYITSTSATGETSLIFPNEFVRDKRIYPGSVYIFPAERAPFAWQVHGEPGTVERLAVVVSERPLAMKGFDFSSLPSHEKSLFNSKIVQVVPNVGTGVSRSGIGSVELEFQIVGGGPHPQPGPERPDHPAPTGKTKRVGMIFSQTHMNDKDGNYEEDRNADYRVANAIHVVNALNKYGKFDEKIGIIYEKDFNKKKITETFAELAQKTNPGDEIFIYWESHGETGKRDTGGRESDGKHESLCMYDYYTNKKDGYILDDDFAEMLTVFKGRRVMILMEACHSGGLLESSSRNTNTNAKNISNQLSKENLSRVCRGDIDYTSLVKNSKSVLNFSDVRSNNAQGSLLDAVGSLAGGKGDAKGESNEQVFLKNFAARLKKAKDLSADTPDLAIIFSCSKQEVSYCTTLDDKGEEVMLADSNGVKRKIGAPVYALVLAMAKTDSNQTLFDDVWNIAKDLIPANAARIAAGNENARDATQVPVYMNTVKDICIRPAK